jgi:hypothetical protein
MDCKERKRKTVLQYLPMAYKGVFVSINPRNVPCAASAITMGGAPKALKVRNCSAGTRIGESCDMKKNLNRLFEP